MKKRKKKLKINIPKIKKAIKKVWVATGKV